MQGIDCYCLEDELLLEGVKSKGHHRTVRDIYLLACFKQQPSVMSVRGHRGGTDNRQHDRRDDNFVNPINISSARATDRLNICFASYIVRGCDRWYCLNVKSNRLKLFATDFCFDSCGVISKRSMLEHEEGPLLCYLSSQTIHNTDGVLYAICCSF